VGVYATAAKTPLVLRQIVGRFVRTLPALKHDPSWLYIPADPILREHAAIIEQDVRHALRDREETTDSIELDRDERRETERGQGLLFEPLSADVAPQMTLFGPAPSAKRAAAPTPVPLPSRSRSPRLAPGTVEEPASASEEAIPAFERRAHLRRERHRLVSDVTRRERTSQREINGWVNREVGIGSVEKATLRELERSIELLLKRLNSRR
jgi:hypothetical protein